MRKLICIFFLSLTCNGADFESNYDLTSVNSEGRIPEEGGIHFANFCKLKFLLYFRQWR